LEERKKGKSLIVRLALFLVIANCFNPNGWLFNSSNIFSIFNEAESFFLFFLSLQNYKFLKRWNNTYENSLQKLSAGLLSGFSIFQTWPAILYISSQRLLNVSLFWYTSLLRPREPLHFYSTLLVEPDISIKIFTWLTRVSICPKGREKVQVIILWFRRIEIGRIRSFSFFLFLFCIKASYITHPITN